MILFREIPLGAGEETSCRRCAGAGDQASVETVQVGEALAAALESGSENLFFTGLGAMDHESLLQLVSRAADAGVSRIGVRLSASQVVQSREASALLSAGMRVAEVTFLSAEAGRHDSFTGTPGSFEASAGAVARLREAAGVLGVRLAVRGRVPICSHNLHDAPATVMRLAEMGVSSMVLACDPSLDVRRSAEWVAAACDTGTVNRVWVAVTGMPEGALGDKALHAVDVVRLREVS